MDDNGVATGKEDAFEKITKGNYRCSYPNPEKIKDDLDRDDVEDETESWEDYKKKNPKECEAMETYTGFAP